MTTIVPSTPVPTTLGPTTLSKPDSLTSVLVLENDWHNLFDGQQANRFCSRNAAGLMVIVAVDAAGTNFVVQESTDDGATWGTAYSMQNAPLGGSNRSNSIGFRVLVHPITDEFYVVFHLSAGADVIEVWRRDETLGTWDQQGSVGSPPWGTSGFARQFQGPGCFLPNGDLMLVGAKNGDFHVTISTDNGVTIPAWDVTPTLTWAETGGGGFDTDAAGLAICATASGEVHVALCDGHTVGQFFNTQYTKYDGSTWSAFEIVHVHRSVSNNAWPRYIEIVTDDDDNPFISLPIQQPSGMESNLTSMGVANRIGGSWSVTWPMAEASTEFGWQHTIAARGNDIIVLALNDTTNELWCSESFDSGATWTDPVDLALTADPNMMSLVHDNAIPSARLLTGMAFVYSDRAGVDGYFVSAAGTTYGVEAALTTPVPTTLAPTTPAPTTPSPTTIVTTPAPTTLAPTTPSPTTLVTTLAPTTTTPTTLVVDTPPPAEPTPLAVRTDIPTAVRVRVRRHQLINAFLVEWDLEWVADQVIEPDGVRQTVERSRFPNGPFRAVGRNLPGTRTSFTDLSADAATFHKQWYYRVICQRVTR